MANVLVNDCEVEVVYDSDDDKMARSKVVTTGVGDDLCSMIFRKRLDSKNGNSSPLIEQDNAGWSFNAPYSLGDLDAASKCYMLNDNQRLKETPFYDDETSIVKDRFSVNDSVKGILSGHIDSMEDNIDGNIEFYSNVASPDKGFLARLDYVDSQEPGELAQVKALEYVNTFLSNIDVTYSPGVSNRKILRAKSPPVSIIKGSQSLVKLIHHRSSTREKGSFEWVDSQNEVDSDIISNKEMMGFSRTYPRLKAKSPPVSIIKGSQSLVNLIEHKSPTKEKCSFEWVDSQNEVDTDTISNKEMMGFSPTNPRFMSHDLKENGYTEEVSETQTVRQLIKELDAESSGKQFEQYHIEKDVEDEVYDEVFNTQMAAEVMETLSCKSPAKINEDSHSDLTNDKAQLEQPSFKRKPFSAPGIVSRNSKRFKVPAEQMVLDPYTVRRKLDRAMSLTKKDVYFKNNIASKDLCKNSTKPINQKGSVTFSPIATRTRQAKLSSSLHNSKEVTNDVLEFGIKYSRERSSASCVRQKNPKSGSNITRKSRSSKQSPEEETSSRICASTKCLTLDVWSYPKGKRTGRNCTPVASFSRKEDTSHSANSMNLLKGSVKLRIPESVSNFSLKYTRILAHNRVLFSQHLDKDMIKHQKKILRRLGSSVASSYLDATHFIADKFSRTRNMLECIALGKPVVTPLWLESCAVARCYLDEKKYILRDVKKEKEIRFSMPVSLASASQRPLLKGHKVLITQNVRPDMEMIASLAKAVQGQVVETIHDSMIRDGNILNDLLIISCEEDYTICARFLDKGVAVYNSELLLNGIVIQKLEYERHQLFKCQIKKNCANRSRNNTNLSHSVEII